MSRLPGGSGAAAGGALWTWPGRRKAGEQNSQEPQPLSISSHMRTACHQGLFLQREVLAIAPFGPGGIVIAHLVKTEQPQGEQSVRRTDAALSIGDDLTLGSDPSLLKHGAEFGRGFELFCLGVHIVEPFEMDRAGNPPAALGAPGVFAGPLRIRAHVEQALSPRQWPPGPAPSRRSGLHRPGA